MVEEISLALRGGSAAVLQCCSPAALQGREALLPAAAMVWRVLIVLFQQVHAEVTGKVAPD